MFHIRNQHDARSLFGRAWLDWASVLMCAALLAFPLPGAARMMVLPGWEILTGSEEELRHEIATQRRSEESLNLENGRSWLAPPLERPRGCTARAAAPSVVQTGHRLANGHNAPMAC